MRKQYVEMYNEALYRCSLKEPSEFMSEKLKELNGISAEQILVMSGQADSVPVDLDEVVRALWDIEMSNNF